MIDSRLFEEVFYQSRIPQLIGSQDMKHTQYNKAFCEFLGYTMEEIHLLSVFDISHPDDIHYDFHLFNEILAGNRDEYEIEKRYLHKNGTIKTGMLNVSKINEQSTGQIYLLGQVIDITEKKKMEMILRNREQKYRLLAEHSSDVITSHDEDFSFQYISPSVENLLGYYPEEMYSMDPRSLIHQEDLKEIVDHQSYNLTDNSVLVTYRCRKKDGTYTWLETTIKAICEEDSGRVKEIISVSRDISRRIDTNERLRKSEKLAVVGQMAAAVAHEIRNPLTAIKGFMQLFSKEREINPAFLSIILDELDRVETIISEFLTMAKPHAEKTVPVQVDQLVEQVIQLLQTQALMKNKEILFYKINPIFPINGDPNSLKQVFMNVIQNSLDAISELGQIEVSLFADSTGIHVKIADNGCGISKERLAKLGEPFYSTKEKGTGLGLMTSYRIIENHHGKINVESVEGEGTTATIWFPS
ncbi:MAG: PAS domain S-box protein [Neobacillus sp.]